MPRAALLLFIFSALAARASEPLTLKVGGLERTCLLHVPAGLDPRQPAPLVLALHGHGGRGAQMENFTRFSALADREGFLVAYPDGIGRSWNDGRDNAQAEAALKHVDDLAFFDAFVAAIGKRHPLDPRRIYVTGMSNGGFMSFTLAARRAQVFAAAAPVCGGIGTALAADFSPAAPVSVLVIQGTADPIVPYGGGEVRQGRGHFIGTDDAINLWLKADACPAQSARAELPDRDRLDGCRVTT
ncbi:MAG TPA: PHB depolymerase family esterase, partial [Opitutaceae bacterium]|nr:PHB depolymerase family esterase [Opitutaceae bacterium]